jgi:diguanylate cyclase (GGDEF)-like protein/PAS domain S-box-containing protein
MYQPDMPKHAFESLGYYIDMLLDAICVVDPNGYFIYVSAGAERIFGYTREEMIGRQMLDLVHPEDRDKTLAVVADIMDGVSKVDFENRYIRKDGQTIDLLWSARWSEADKMRVAVARDITSHKRSEALQKALFDISEAAHAVDSLTALYQRIHQIIAELMPVGQFAIALYDPVTASVTFPYQKIETAKLNKLDIVAFCSEVSKNGESQLKQLDESCACLGISLKSRKGSMGCLMLTTEAPQHHGAFAEQALLEFVSEQVASAIERKQMLENLHHMAMYDQLTGLPNRQLFDDRVRQALARAKRNTTRLALLYLDLDKFKAANDNLGHEVGDLLLIEVAQRLKASVRRSDTVARFGGDEFVVLLDEVEDPTVVRQIASNMLSELARPYTVETHQIEMSASIGMALYPDDGSGEAALRRHADAAMYAAKREGGNCLKS